MLQQRGPVRQYTSAFMTLCLHIPNLPSSEQFEYHRRGLKPAIRKEIEIRGITTVDEAATVADRVDSISFAARNGNGASSARADYSPYSTPDSASPPQYDPMDIDTMEVRRYHRRLPPSDRVSHQPYKAARLTRQERGHLTQQDVLDQLL
jgi:hypothetical protein